ncbi:MULTISPECIES: hypothetical protein [unclassified Mesorhizobium]|uniref:hypothetical protein n=1 Tax=unclassified Mesorhizobium TaxID=325217 RepID=UPI00121821BD|nr:MULTISPECIES: hypothetical protein [unclassified Mesorhizobium]TIV08325.1 MAG: hypothetical protein E5V94_09180 [Mesorhizobium sp.]
MKAAIVMHRIEDTKKLAKEVYQREWESLVRIKETQELIETNRRLTERSRELSAMLLAGLATGFDIQE